VLTKKVYSLGLTIVRYICPYSILSANQGEIVAIREEPIAKAPGIKTNNPVA
jgi:hypothetical protein